MKCTLETIKDFLPAQEYNTVDPALRTPKIQWTALFVLRKSSFLIGQFPITFLPMGKC